MYLIFCTCMLLGMLLVGGLPFFLLILLLRFFLLRLLGFIKKYNRFSPEVNSFPVTTFAGFLVGVLLGAGLSESVRNYSGDDMGSLAIAVYGFPFVCLFPDKYLPDKYILLCMILNWSFIGMMIHFFIAITKKICGRLPSQGMSNIENDKLTDRIVK